MTEDFIAFLALNNDLLFLMVVGALFQALVASFMNLQVDFSEKPSSINLPPEYYNLTYSAHFLLLHLRLILC